jgi:hypothetical protein
MATPQQMRKLIQVFEDTPTEQMTAVLGSGSLADARDADYTEWSPERRDASRNVYGLKPLNPPPLFRFIDEVVVPMIGPFMVDRIKVGTVDGVDIGYVDPFFTECFGGLVDGVQGPTSFRRNELTRIGSCSAINETLGYGVEEATCGQIVWLMANGKIRKDGKATIFRARDAKGVLRLVVVIWRADDGGWRVYADEVDCAHGWRAGRYVFSRSA